MLCVLELKSVEMSSQKSAAYHMQMLICVCLCVCESVSKERDTPTSRAANNNSCCMFTAVCLSVCVWKPLKKGGGRVSRKGRK